MPNNQLACEKFTQFLVHQVPVFDKLIVSDLRPQDGWIGHVETGIFPPYSDTVHTFDRFNHVHPDITKQWESLQSWGGTGGALANGGQYNGACVDHPCDPHEHCLGWGYTRDSYYLERQSWATPLLCYDQLMHVTHAKEHFRQIITDILKPATANIMSNFMKKRAADMSSTQGNAWVASAAQTNFTFHWHTGGVNNDEEIFIDATAIPTSKLTPQMLMRRFEPLVFNGYFGKQPFRDMPGLIELVTDTDTCWELDRAAVQNNIGQWQYQQWAAGNEFYKYAFSGKIGNYVIRVDPFSLRFNYIGRNGTDYRFQVVLPYTNQAATQGLRSVVNPHYQDATYQFSFIWHRRAAQALVSSTEQVNPEMPFASRDFGGKWQFVMDNLGADINGNPIENKRRNKGQFIGDYKLAWKPQYPEFCELIFHKREPACLVEIDTCQTDSGYTTEDYDSCPADVMCDGCPE